MLLPIAGGKAAEQREIAARHRRQCSRYGDVLASCRCISRCAAPTSPFVSHEFVPLVECYAQNLHPQPALVSHPSLSEDNCNFLLSLFALILCLRSTNYMHYVWSAVHLSPFSEDQVNPQLMKSSVKKLQSFLNRCTLVSCRFRQLPDVSQYSRSHTTCCSPS